ncbi:DUF4817 domain-containing protein [Trichonephila clavipes]|nr:DUF4817 domain-containing protein [Trichonephila clavipes]
MPSPVFGNRIVDLELIVEAFAQLCCPKCFVEKVELFEDSRYGLCSHFTLKSGTFCWELCSTLNLPRLTKTAYKNQEAKLLKVVQEVAEESMIRAATEIVEKKQNLSSNIVKCGISVDGTWQRRGYTSMNGCVTAISVDTGKVLDIEVMSSYSPTYGDRFNSCQVIYSQFGLAIHQNDHQARRRFVEFLFRDEAHFWLNDYVNKQNCRIWSEANRQVYVETPLHPEKLTVWCSLWAGGIIGPYFFKNDECHNVTVNGDRYRAMITNFFILELNNHDVQELWFQQDGATCHTARATIDLLKDTFGDRLISEFGPVNWPPRSCDLTPLDYFLWGYVKSLVYADKPQTLTPI